MIAEHVGRYAGAIGIKGPLGRSASRGWLEPKAEQWPNDAAAVSPGGNASAGHVPA